MQGHRLDQISVDEMPEQRVHGVLAHGMTLCLQVQKQAMHAHVAGWIAQAMADNPA